ncbi:hypothetical protein [Paenibacillus massiliensis]|uniref:hypothetical protein n=1 Tax=Paenibacillus massiliensis TaxID=225917 RepID=UPI00048D4F49|nr:hypothetical protein [Paenibacillus massiliensis]
MFQIVHPCSPVEQEFIWHAEYNDQTSLSEYDFVTKEENLFKSIDANKLIRFGLIGQGQRLYYEVNSGIFKIIGKMYEFSYVTANCTYSLTGQQIKYNDHITFKSAEMFVDPVVLKTVIDPVITDYSFGYKVSLLLDGVEINFKALCVISYDNPMYLNLRLVSSKSLDGELVIKRNGMTIDKIKAPLNKKIAGETNWIIQ